MNENIDLTEMLSEKLIKLIDVSIQALEKYMNDIIIPKYK